MTLRAVQEPTSAPRTASLVPPRPNPGPEPWRDESPFPTVAILAAALAVAAAVAFLRRRRREGSSIESPGVPADDSPEARLLALCDRLRGTLAARLGPSLRARTTEEVAADPRVAEMLDGGLDPLLTILAAGDRVKFARREAFEGLDESLPGWIAWADSLASRPRPRRPAEPQRPLP